MTQWENEYSNWPISVYYFELDDVFIKDNDKRSAVCHILHIRFEKKK